MRNQLAILVLALTILSCQKAKDEYVINGSIAGVETGKVYLQKVVNGNPQTIDSTTIANGKFTFKGKMTMPDIRILRLNQKDYFAQFFLENADVNVKAAKDSLRKTKITGSPSQDIFQIFIAEMQKLNKEGAALQGKYQSAMIKGNSSEADKAKIDLQAMIDNNLVFTKNFVKEHSTSVVSAYVALVQLSSQIDGTELESIVSKYPPEISTSEYVVRLKEIVDAQKKTAVGVVAPDFTMNTPEGNPLQLSSYRGKIVLVDFWASWCGPCRQENPNLVRLYQQFHPKGFEILGVSLDRSKDEWVKAIQVDQLTWNHVSDLQFWQNSAARLYSVNVIPQSFLIDKEGKILAKITKPEQLEGKLKELFPN